MAGTLDGFKKQLTAMTKRIDTVNTVMAPVAVGMVQANMTKGPWTPNAPLTQALKNGGSRALINTGETRASITYVLTESGFTVGTNKKHAPLINYGGTVTAKKAQKLILPASKDVKARVDSWGVKQTLDWLESSGWDLIWRPGALIGKCPEGRKGFGVQIAMTKGKARRKNKRTSKRFSYYLIFYRKKSITVPKREFMVLKPDQVKLLNDIGKQYLMKGTK
jgi:phage gpG-like protein